MWDVLVTQDIVPPQEMACHDACGSVDAGQAMDRNCATLEVLPDGCLHLIVGGIHTSIIQGVPVVHRLANDGRLLLRTAYADFVLARRSRALVAIHDQRKMVEDLLPGQRACQSRLVA
eukprot:CAMPEP_0170593978 /NCGR_PEP_ID=MMETSP0224-20130122/13748_1 /TAXON_ID=285029 /ORGANISM="Togula jolla, Strain CCCM 725" /LENGTH=117 /DNA_ID=CAMNT_0010917991 /DNA_START=257 /DNA_END=610 /DNA_ORIENTATION=-